MKNAFVTKVRPLLFFAALGVAASIVFSTYAHSTLAQTTETPLNIYLFYSKTCPHCAREKLFLGKMLQKYPQLTVSQFEITTNRDNGMLFQKVGQRLQADISAVPFLVIGDKYVLGYFNEETTGTEIESLITAALATPPADIVGDLIKPGQAENLQPAIEAKPTKTQSGSTPLVFELPFLGKLNTKNMSLPVFTLVIALLDGFNPCAMWTLLFLISMLLGMKNRKKMWLMGGTFILASGVVYFLFMAAWLNFFLFIGYTTIVRYIIGLLALGGGIYYIRNYYKNRDGGCDVTADEKRRRTFEKIRAIIQKESLWLALIGLAMLAVAVNIVELLCSAGLPAVYTKILTMSQMPKWLYYLYLVGYIFIFMLDDIIVFTIAMVTLQAKGIESKYGRYSHLIGGIIILIIGILMLVKPEILMFRF